MRKTTMLTAAIAVAFMTSGIALMPAQAGVAMSCTQDDDVPDDPQLLPITLGSSETDVWRVIVTTAGPVDVRVSLQTGSDHLDFGVFYLDGTTCKQASLDNLTVCTDEEELDTHGVLPPEEQTCSLAAPAQNEDPITYFFVLENNEADSLGYKIWEV